MDGGVYNLHYDDVYRLAVVGVGDVHTAATYGRRDRGLTTRSQLLAKREKEAHPLTSP